MWIIPNNITTMATIREATSRVVDLNILVGMLEKSLLARSAYTRANTWLRKLKQDKQLQKLHKQVLAQTHEKRFVCEWAAYQINPLARYLVPYAESLKSTQARSNPTIVVENWADLPLFSLNNTVEVFAVDICDPNRSDTSKKNEHLSSSDAKWGKWVLLRRGNYSQRLILASKLRQEALQRLRWATPNANDDCKRGPNTATANTYLSNQVLDPTQKPWATPNTMDCPPPRSPEALKKHLTEGARAGRTSSGNLREQVGEPAREAIPTTTPLPWATPTAGTKNHEGRLDYYVRRYSIGKQVSLCGQVIMEGARWATPTQGDGNRLGTETTDQWRARADKKKEQGINLHRPLNIEALLDAESQTPPNVGQLNPRWVETLMGLPIGWVMPNSLAPISIVQECSEMVLPPQPLNETSESSDGVWATPKAGTCGMTARTSERPIEKSTHLTTQVHLEECKAWGTQRANMGYGTHNKTHKGRLDN